MKTISTGQVSFEGKGASLATKMNITFFMENEVLNSYSSNNFFEKKQHFSEKWQKILGGGGHEYFLEGIILHQK